MRDFRWHSRKSACFKGAQHEYAVAIRYRVTPGRYGPSTVRSRRQQHGSKSSRNIAHPAVSAERLSLTTQGFVRYHLEISCRDSTTDVVFESLDFIARLATLVLALQVNVTRCHDVFAPNYWLGEKMPTSDRYLAK